MADTQLDAQYEILAKTLSVYADPKFKPLAEKVFDTLGYKVDRVFEDPANTFFAVGLSSKDSSKAPVILLPGGNGGDPGSVGAVEFASNKQEIQDWFANITNNQQLNPKGLKPDVTGASRGGALTQLVASEFPTLIGSAISFVSPGIDRKDADKFLENGGNPDQVRHYITNGDYRSLLGEAFIPGKVVVSNYEIPFSVPKPGEVDYATRKHSSGILADFSTLFPDTSNPEIAQIRALTDIPVGNVLSETSVEALNQPDFNWQGKDWQSLVEVIRSNNPNLARLIEQRQNIEDSRDNSGFGSILKLTGEAIQGINPVPADRVNKPTANDDILFGSEDDDRISGRAGDDYITGGSGDDRLFGNQGKDGLVGGTGDDILNGGANNDTLKGGEGDDLFLFGDCTPFSSAALGIDRINDFTVDEDSIGLRKATFTNICDDFASVFGTVTDDVAAETSEAAIVYNTSNGKLFYNNNGLESGFGDGGQFANIFGKPALSAESFTLT
jgi:serralysin